MDFPKIVYKCPGPHFGPSGTTYQSVGVSNQKDFDLMLKDGWHKSLPDAVKSISIAEELTYSTISREEMLQQAKKLGIKVDNRWSDDTLLQKINDLMK